MSDQGEFKELGTLEIPYEPTPDVAHKIEITTMLDSALQHMEASIEWQSGTSVPELLVGAATLVGNLGRLMLDVSRAIDQTGQDGRWAKTNAAVLGSMAEALGQMAGTEDAGKGRPGVQH